MGEKQKTEHKRLADIEQAPDYMKPYADMNDLENRVFLDFGEEPGARWRNKDKIVNPDTSFDAAVRRVMADDSVLDDKAAAEILNDRYEEFYGQYEAEMTEKQIEKARKDAGKALEKLQEQEAEQAAHDARPEKEYLWSQEYQQEFIENYLENEKRRNREANATAAMGMALSGFLDDLSDTQFRNAIADEQKKAENVCRMNEVLEYISSASFEYLTRGAMLACSCGVMRRKLNLPQSHGVYYGTKQDPVIHRKDCEVGDQYNITNFGLCGGSNPPQETVELEDLVITDEMGRFLAPKNEDKVERGYRCMPEILAPGWHNTYDRTEMGSAGASAVSTQSFLVCVHGGIIYPVNSGQHSNLLLLSENDTELNDTFDRLCEEYRETEEKMEALQQAVRLNVDGEEVERGMTDSEMEELGKLIVAREEYLHKLECCMDRARADGYQKGYEDIPPDRKATLNHMLKSWAELPGNEGEEIPSVKSDYYRYRRKDGYTKDSAYYKEDPGFLPGSDAYTDWRTTRLEYMEDKEAQAEWKAWEKDVKERGYEHLSLYEKEEFERAKKKYGNTTS